MTTERDEENIARLRAAYAAFSRGDYDAAVAAGVRGIEVETHTFGVWTIDDDGLAIRLEIFQEPDEADARRAAGLAA